jgi:hypothetical protein
MKKKILPKILAAFALGAMLSALSACGGTAPVLDQSGYVVSDGESLATLSGQTGISYRLIGSVPDGVTLSSAGVFTIASSVPNGTQVLVSAKKGKNTVTTVCTLSVPTETPTLDFTNLSDYVLDGEQVHATSTPLYSVSYSLKEEVNGVSIDSVSGKVSYTAVVQEDTVFTVQASANGVTEEKTFYAATDPAGYVTATSTVATAEYQAERDVSFTVSYGANETAKEQGVLGVAYKNRLISEENYTYDKATNSLTLKGEYLSTLGMGENNFKIYTAKNTVSVTVRTAIYITTAEELASINSTQEALAGYYILARDIDMSDYLKKVDGAWKPIGVYYDVTDGTATDWAFSGTFDGNGHTLSGFYVSRSDSFAYNAGLFGYVSRDGIIQNLTVTGATSEIRSYSGGLVGVNCGIIQNCYVNVNVSAEGCKDVGGFVGRNEGTIKNCYSSGTVSAQDDVGVFCGINTGTIQNCRAVKSGELDFCGAGSVTDCELVESKSQLNVPAFSSVDVEYGLRGLTITNEETYYTKGNTVQIKAEANSTFTENIEYTLVEGEGVTVNSTTGKVDISKAAGNTRCTVKASCGEFSDTYTFTIYDKATSVKFTEDMETTVQAGGYYRLTSVVTPDTANQEVVYKLTEGLNGVTLDGDLLSIDRYTESGTIEVTVNTLDEKRTDTLTITVEGATAFEENSKILYTDENSVSFTLPTGTGTKIEKVTRYDKKIEYTLSGDTVTIDKKYFSGMVGCSVPVNIYTSDGKNYIATVSVYDREKVVTIGSVEEFMKFKADANNYDKIIILTADLDFEGAEITSAGWYTEENGSLIFSGTFNGNGHTIKNLTIVRNGYTGDDEDGYKTDKYHSSYYNVGLFSYVTGTVRDVTFENVTVKPLFDDDVTGNFVGIVCGTLEGRVERCTFIHCEYDAGGDIKGLVAGKDLGEILCCYEEQ